MLGFCSFLNETSGLSAPTLQNLRPHLYPTRLAECCGCIGSSCVPAAMLRPLDLAHLAAVQVQVVEEKVERGRAKDPGMVQEVLVQEKVDAARKAEGGKARACGHFFANIDSTLHIVNDREVCPFLTAYPLATARSVLCSRSLSAANHRLTPATLAIHRRRSSS